MNVAIKQFLGSMEARNCSVHTLRAYEKTLTDFSSHLGNMPARKLDRQHVRGFMRYLGERGLVKKSLQRELGAVRSFAKWLYAEGLVPVDVAHGIMTPKFPTHLPDVPSQAEVRTLLDGELKTPFPERDRALLVLLYATGIRVAELCDIKLEDFEEPDIVIVRGKGKRERRVIYGKTAKAALDAYMPVREKMLNERTLTTLLPRNALFLSLGPNVGLQGLNVRSVGRILKEAASAKGLDPKKFHPHMLRRCFATHLHDNGCPIEAVYKLLGHTNLSTTVIYTQVSTARMVQSYNAAHPHAQKFGLSSPPRGLLRPTYSSRHRVGATGRLSLAPPTRPVCLVADIRARKAVKLSATGRGTRFPMLRRTRRKSFSASLGWFHQEHRDQGLLRIAETCYHL